MKKGGFEKSLLKFSEIEFLCFLLFKWWKSEDLKNCSWNFVKIEFFCFLYKSNSYVLYCLSDEKVRIWKIILEILLKSNSYVFYYLTQDSHVF